MKRLLAMLVCAALLCAGLAYAQSDAGIAYKLPEGASALSVSEVGAQQIPRGLNAMYALMQDASSDSIVFVFRMKHGRALASVSISPIDEGVDAKALHGKWQAIAATLSRNMAYVNMSEGCATLEERYGREALVIQTDGVVGEDSTLLLDLSCVALTEGSILIEIWSAAPADTTYAFDNTAYAECTDDRRDMAALLESLDFSGLSNSERKPEKPKQAFETVRYTDPKGRFEADIIKDCIIITADSTEDEAHKLRDALVEKYGEGAGRLFDINYKDVRDEDATYITLPDLSGAAAIYRVLVPSFINATTDDLLLTAPSVTKSLAEKFGGAQCLYDDGTISISGVEHAWTAYWLRSGQTDILLNLMAAVDEGGHLRELDVFKMTDDPGGELCDALMYTLINTIKYTVPEGQP